MPAFVRPDAARQHNFSKCPRGFSMREDGHTCLYALSSNTSDAECFRLGGVLAGTQCVFDNTRRQCLDGFVYYDDFCWYEYESSAEMSAALGNAQQAKDYCSQTLRGGDLPTILFNYLLITDKLSEWLSTVYKQVYEYEGTQRFLQHSQYIWYVNEDTNVAYCVESGGVKQCDAFDPQLIPICSYHISRFDGIRDRDVAAGRVLQEKLRDGQPGDYFPKPKQCDCYESWGGKYCEIFIGRASGLSEEEKRLSQVCTREENFFSAGTCACKEGYGPPESGAYTGCECAYANGKRCGDGECVRIYDGKSFCSCASEFVGGDACSCGFIQATTPYFASTYDDELNAAVYNTPCGNHGTCTLDGCDCDAEYGGYSCSCAKDSDGEVCGGEERAIINVSGFYDDAVLRKHVTGAGCGATLPCFCNSNFTGSSCSTRVSAIYQSDSGALKSYTCGENAMPPRGSKSDSDGRCVCNSNGIANTPFSFSIERWHGSACQCLGTMSSPCFSNGVCVEPSFQDGRCTEDESLHCSQDWHCMSTSKGFCNMSQPTSRWLNGAPDFEVTSVGHEGGCLCKSSFEEGYYSQVDSCRTCDANKGPRTEQEWDLISEELKGNFAHLSFNEAKCRFPYAIANVVGQAVAYLPCSGSGNSARRWHVRVRPNFSGELCERCSEDLYGPKPRTDTRFACVFEGGYDPETNVWSICGGHQYFNETTFTCGDCYEGWAKSDGKFCDTCSPGYGFLPELARCLQKVGFATA